MKQKLLIVTRHAHRDVLDAFEDNGLSEKGLRQALALRSHFETKFKNEKPLLLSSPRLRCQETLQRLAELFQVELDISELLDEGFQTKGGRLQDRVLKFRDWWLREAPSFCVICSHGDWLPLFFSATIHKDLDLKKAGYAELETNGSEVTLKHLIQRWPL